MANKRLILIDGNALVHRGFYALPDLRSPEGEPTGASFGFTSIFLKTLEELKPDYVAVTFDLEGPTIRHKVYKEYKAKRVKAPQEMYDQLPRVKEICQAFNLPIFEKQGFEADDLIGTITGKLSGKKDLETFIVTGDLDLLQLISKNTKVCAPLRGFSNFRIYNEQEVRERYGLRADQIVDFKALRGDPSDNIPGVAGIGEKGAAELIKKFSSLENLYKNLDKVPEKYRKLLKGQKKQAFESFKLCQLIKDVPIRFNLEDAKLSDYEPEKVKKVFQKLGFMSLLKRLPKTEHKEYTPESLFGKPQDLKIRPKGLKFISEEKELTNLLKQLKDAEWLAIDTKFVFDKKRPLGIAIGDERANYFVAFKDIPKPVLKRELSTFLSEKKIIGYNLKEDYKNLKRLGIEIKNLLFDTILAAYLLNPNFSNYSLKSLSFDFLGIEIENSDEVFGEGKLRKLNLDKLQSFAAQNLEVIKKLYQVFWEKISTPKFSYVKKLQDEIELPLSPVLAEMEIIGVKIDPQVLNKLSKELKKKLADLTSEIHKLAKGKFNINSPQQLKEVLFDKLKISTLEIRKTKTGLSTAASELEKLRGRHKIIDKILEYREFSKLVNTYIDVLPKLVDKDSRLHTTFNQAQTRTGRLSSLNPNLQNIPTRTEIGEKIRSAFVAAPQKVFISADYSQFDLRIAAAIADDKEMIKAFKNNEDIHQTTATKILKVKPEKVTKQMRRIAKTVNFGVLFGMNFFGLAERAGIKREKAKEFIREYFYHFKGIERYTKEIVERTRKLGYAETLFGRRRYIPEINSKTTNVRKAAERIAINMPIQGTAADIIKLAMVKVAEDLDKTKVWMILQVHDELLFEVDKDIAKESASKIAETMAGVYKLQGVDLKVDLKIGPNWSNLEKIN